ncbi:hypothetical protein CRUP_010628, partial [Coryphaenoides rupestris]
MQEGRGGEGRGGGGEEERERRRGREGRREEEDERRRREEERRRRRRRMPVQGFDYAKQHIGRPGDETISVTKETLVLALPARDAPLSLDRKAYQDGTANKRPPSTDMHKG